MERGFDTGREILKWVAIVSMTIDHIGASLYPQYEVLRLIGRLSFPLFCYLLVLGLENTRNVGNYFVRLFLFALVSQVPFYLAFGIEPFESFNVFFTLSSGLAFIYFYKSKNAPLALLPVLASLILHFDYGIYGIFLIGCMYLIREDAELGTVSVVLLNLAFSFMWPTQFMSLFSLPLILYHNSRASAVMGKTDVKGVYPRWKKYLFYAYYPLHLLALYAVRIII